MRSASSADRSAICITFNLPHENAIELQNLARSCDERLRELGVLALQVGNATAISLQPGSGSTCQSVTHGGSRDRRLQTLNATRTNIARYLGADTLALPPESCSATGIVLQNSIHERGAGPIASMSTGVTVEQPSNMVAESSPHIVNLLQQDALSGSVCLSSSVPMSPANDTRPRKRARRRPAAASTENTLVPLTLHGTPDYANSVYSSQQTSQCAEYSLDTQAVQHIEQFKIPVSRRRKPCSSRKGAASKSQQLPVTGPASVANSFSAGFNEGGKANEVAMFQAAASCNLGDSFQMNGISPYHRIPVMSAGPGWQPFSARSTPSNGLHQFPLSTAPYPSEYGHYRLRFSGNINYSQVPANASRAPDLGNYRGITPGSQGMFAPNPNQRYLKEEQINSIVPQKPLHWLPPTESQPESVLYGSSSIVTHQLHQVHNVAPDRSRCPPTSQFMQRSFMAHPPDMLSISEDSKHCTETVVPASGKLVSADRERLKISSMPVCRAVQTNCVTCVTGEHVNMPPSFTYQRANGLLTDVHSSALGLRDNAGHVKVNGEVGCLHQVVRKSLSTSSTVTDSPYACLASPTTANIIDANCFSERQLQQASVQLPTKTQQYVGTDFDLNGCSTDTLLTNTLKASVLPGVEDGVTQAVGQQCYATPDDTLSS